ncbi:MAG: hypothetical protein Q4G59_12710, partial [Planctomycetia bacterium]|nr:hypothetical protein [Planctomycetia bacterium]
MERDNPVNPDENQVNQSEKPRQTVQNDAEIAKLLQGATDEFANVFQEGASKQETKAREMNVADDIKEQYTHIVRPELVPKIDQNSATNDNNAKKYLLQYKFQAGQALRWQVVHTIRKKVTFAGKTQGIQTLSKTRRCWNVKEKTPEGKYRCEHIIEDMILTQNEDGKDPISYDSRKDTKVPQEFARFGTDKTVRTVLESFDIDAPGVMSNKKKYVPEFHGLETDSKVLVPFPLEPVAVGESWTIPYTIFLRGRDKSICSYQAVLKFTLDRVEGDLAMIRFRSILLALATDPVIEGQLAEKLYTGRSLFDLKQGRTLETELDFSKSVANAMGEMSHLEYACHLTEKLIRPGSDLELKASESPIVPIAKPESKQIQSPTETNKSK